MLRVDRRSEASDRCLLSVQGEITGRWTELLAEQCEAELARATPASLALDLAQVRYVDAGGRRLLQHLGTLGVRLVHCPPLIRAQLDDEAPDDDPR